MVVAAVLLRTFLMVAAGLALVLVAGALAFYFLPGVLGPALGDLWAFLVSLWRWLSELVGLAGA